MASKTNNLGTRAGPSTNIILTVIVVLVAMTVIGGVLLFSGSNNDRGDNQGADAAAVPAEQLRAPDSHTLTEAPDGKATVVEFLDYQCPACAAYYENVTKQVEQDYDGRITFVTRNFPLEMHPLAMPAAQAAEAAALQGSYQQMYHALYDNWTSWALTSDGQSMSNDEQRARTQFDQFAQQIGLDLDQFHRDMASQQVTDRINQDKTAGEQAGVQGTPTIFVNGTKFEPTGETFPEVADQLRGQLDQELNR
ncbi:MAG: DsbA family protein [Actinobacteria bacterium]|nr:DsbA family protein [Actinomycetota bacterium]